MRKEYDFTNSRKNPYAKLLKKQISIRLDLKTITYFRKMAIETGVPYQNLMNLYLRECAAQNRRLRFQ